MTSVQIMRGNGEREKGREGRMRGMGGGSEGKRDGERE